MAGAFDREVQQTDPLWQQAHATYISNLQFAADECSKVCLILLKVLFHMNLESV